MAAYRGFMTHVTCRLSAKNGDQLRNPKLGSRVWASFTFQYPHFQDRRVAAAGRDSVPCVGRTRSWRSFVARRRRRDGHYSSSCLDGVALAARPTSHFNGHGSACGMFPIPSLIMSLTRGGSRHKYLGAGPLPFPPLPSPVLLFAPLLPSLFPSFPLLFLEVGPLITANG